jgi:hypothetical protein
MTQRLLHPSMPWDGRPLHFHTWALLTGGVSNQGQGKTTWTEDDRSLGKLKWKVYPTPLREGKGRVLKEKSWRMSVDH